MLPEVGFDDCEEDMSANKYEKDVAVDGPSHRKRPTTAITPQAGNVAKKAKSMELLSMGSPPSRVAKGSVGRGLAPIHMDSISPTTATASTSALVRASTNPQPTTTIPPSFESAPAPPTISAPAAAGPDLLQGSSLEFFFPLLSLLLPLLPLPFPPRFLFLLRSLLFRSLLLLVRCLAFLFGFLLLHFRCRLLPRCLMLRLGCLVLLVRCLSHHLYHWQRNSNLTIIV